jgi:hypothetical protein
VRHPDVACHSQYILDQSISNVVPRLAKKLAGFYTELSTGKFSSNVVEKVPSFVALQYF